MGHSTRILRSESTCHLREFSIKPTCPYTPEQNGIAERKNRHLLEVARSMMILINVPKYLWGQAVLTATMLINRRPSRVLEWKSSFEMLKGENCDILPLKIFGCVCFVQDYRPNVDKLDPRAVKCIFVGYSATQKGYVCWSPVERRLFTSMDVTFREHEPYHSSQVTSPFGDSLDTGGMRREGESSTGSERMASVGTVPCPVVDVEKSVVVPEQEQEGNNSGIGGTQAQGELRVYTRRGKQNEGIVPTVPPLVPSPLSLPSPTPETPTSSTTDSEYSGDMIPLSTPPDPLSIRRTTRINAGVFPLIDMVSHITLLSLSLTLTYHLHMEHSLHLWTLSLFLSFGRLLRRTQNGKLQ
jgi:hypothetical protein